MTHSPSFASNSGARIQQRSARMFVPAEIMPQGSIGAFD